MKKSINMAVALKYKAYEDNAPKIVAKGKGDIAKKIIQKAKEFNVPLFQNELLVESLIKVKDEEVPPELYKAVAEVFAWLYNLEKRAELSRS
ncbi:MAG: flagellar biosynthesis protein FlhB [Epsilonproteobacteria bacterium]|nr:flagellar biosynthesis protein FlhB [Campylobacterota bacterium]